MHIVHTEFTTYGKANANANANTCSTRLSIRFYELRMNIKSVKRKGTLFIRFKKQSMYKIAARWCEKKDSTERWITNSAPKVESNKCTVHIWTDCKMCDLFDMLVSNICSRSAMLCLFYLLTRPMVRMRVNRRRRSRRRRGENAHTKSKHSMEGRK